MRGLVHEAPSLSSPPTVLTLHALNLVFFFLPPPFLFIFLCMCALASSGGGDLASEHEGAAGHKAPVGPGTDTEGTSDPEGEGSTTTGTGGETSNSDTSSDGCSLAVAATSGPPASTGTATTQRTSTALPAAPQPTLRARSPRKARVSFAPGTSAPAPVAPAAPSAELIDLVRTLIVGQTTLLNAIQGVQREVQQSNAYLEGIHSGQAAHQRAFTALASALTAAIVPEALDHVDCGMLWYKLANWAIPRALLDMLFLLHRDTWVQIKPGAVMNLSRTIRTHGLK
ncbi:hypothetical protein NDU88_004838 [Pleurodeles waltl]|uniref:Uncharacterized protein n=1 Tax=Pleurodeles waltl TaxID=8319 RepID=A0AAV7NNG7_PLEWA|nr:hypothetical protein NDU88_004838 [Pleurodeles waltl]